MTFGTPSRDTTDERFRLLADSLPLLMAMESGKSVGWDWDLKTNRDIWFGDLSTIFGIPATIHDGHVEDFRRLVHPDDRALVWGAVKDAMERRAAYAAEFRIVWPNGTVCWVSARGQFHYAPDGAPERMLGIAVDITERKDAEDALRRTERELKEVQRLAGVGAWQWDRETDTVSWSDELYRISGRDPALPPVPYLEHAQLFTPESWDRLREAVEAALHAGDPYSLELEMIRTDGTHRWIMGRGEAQRDSAGRIVGLRGTVQDITERKRAEEALSSVNRRLIDAQESERARIARDLHDDIGQRLTLMALTLKRVTGLQPESASEALNCLKALQIQTAEITADVQALSHELHSSRLQLLGVAAAMRGFCKELAAQKHVAIKFHHQHVPASVPADVSLSLFRVLQEALHNAVRYSHVHHFEVHLRGVADTLQLTVRDQGVGFDVEASHGVGLGLTSMKERLKLIGGELLIESHSKRGTIVRASVPARSEGDDRHRLT